jgi:hypothetical protein
MFRRQSLMSAALRQALRSLNESARSFGVFLDIHALPSALGARSSQHARAMH